MLLIDCAEWYLNQTTKNRGFRATSVNFRVGTNIFLEQQHRDHSPTSLFPVRPSFLCDPLLCYTFSIFQNWWNYKFVNLNFYQTLRNEPGRFPFLEKSVVAVPLRFGVHFQVGRAAIPTFARNRPVKFLLRQKWSKWAIARTTTAPKRLAPPAVQRHSKPLPTIVTLILKVWKLKNKFWKL